MSDLEVYLYGHLAGRLVGGDWRTFDFVTDRAAFDHFSLGSSTLSESVPLDAVQNRSRAARRRNFFAELLPEGDSLAFLTQRLRISPSDTIGILRAHGRDVAGALQIFDPEAQGEPRTPALRPLDDRGVKLLLTNLQAQPLGNTPLTGKTSLAGVQPKAVLALVGDAWSQVVDGYPSTHIIKPRSLRHPTTIHDEEFGSRFVRALELSRFSTRLQTFDGEPALVIERYDRASDSPDGRIHQEDMSQALGAHANEKYQAHGGKVSLARMASVFTKRGDHDSARRLLRATVLSVAVGNLDMHAKNISILHPFDGPPTLAPIYDVVPQAHEDNDGEMALAVNGVYSHRAITREDVVTEGASWGVRDPERTIDETLEIISAVLDAESPAAGSHPDLVTDIRRFTDNLKNGRPAGRGPA